MQESKNREFKEKFSKTFLKTVSAFANYDGGEIIFGIDDNGKLKGIADLEKLCLDIENSINDNIEPTPEYTIKTNKKDSTVSLIVYPGEDKPYFYKSKAYRRNDTSTVEVDKFYLRRLVLEGMNINYEELPAKNQDLTFHYLYKVLKETINLEEISLDILKTLNLYNDIDGYNIAANVLSDNNEQLFSIDIARLSDDINIIKSRKWFENMSILEAFDKSLEMFKEYYQYEVIDGYKREKVSIIPEEAFREALANAIIHRAWDINSSIKVLMMEDKIKIVSPGGLPPRITKEDYLSGHISSLRNPILSNIFYRLKIVELLGTGVTRIMQSYKDSISKPIFEINDSSIVIYLPIIDVQKDLSEEEMEIYKALSKTTPKAMGDILEIVPYGKTKTNEILKSMVNQGVVKLSGNGRGTKYRL